MAEDSKARIESLEQRIRELEHSLAEAERVHARKTALFAGGIAHHLNNILTGIFGGLSLSFSALNHPEQITKYLESAQKAAGKAGELTAQLSMLARRDEPIRQSVPVKLYFSEALARAREDRTEISFEIRIPENLPPIAIDMAQFQIVLQHLVRNAAQAMPHGGRIVVEAALTDRPGLAWAAESPDSGHPWIEISFTDNGPGIPPDMLGRVFEPYVSTRTHGTGLGLPVSRAILERHGGHMIVTSERGGGTQVRMLLPPSVPRGEPRKAEPEQRAEKALVVFENAMRGDQVTDNLVALGIDAVKVRSGEEAIECCRDAAGHGQKYHAVFIDAGLMEETAMARLIDALRSQNASMRLLIVTGPENARSAGEIAVPSLETLHLSEDSETFRSRIAAVVQAFCS